MANLKYKPDKDTRAAAVMDEVEAIIGEDFLPVPLQIQRLAVLRDKIQARILTLKAQL